MTYAATMLTSFSKTTDFLEPDETTSQCLQDYNTVGSLQAKVFTVL